MHVTPKGDTEDKSPIYGFFNSGGDKKIQQTIGHRPTWLNNLLRERGKENDKKNILAHSFNCVGYEYCFKLCAYQCNGRRS